MKMVNKEEVEKAQVEWEATWYAAAEPEVFIPHAWKAEKAVYDKYLKLKEAYENQREVM